jgi:hypothetical protein
MNLLGHPKWPSILGFTHGRHISIVVKDILISKIDPLCNRSSDEGENTKKFNCGLDSLGSLISRIIRLNKVCNILKERIMRRETCKKLETRKGEKNWVNTFMEGSSKQVSGRELIITHFIQI